MDHDQDDFLETRSELASTVKNYLVMVGIDGFSAETGAAGPVEDGEIERNLGTDAVSIPRWMDHLKQDTTVDFSSGGYGHMVGRA